MNASVTGCLDRAVYVPVGEGLVLQGRQQQEVVCFEDMRLQQKYDQGQEADYHPCIITIIYYIPQKVQTIVSPTRRGEVLELLADNVTGAVPDTKVASICVAAGDT